jgi:hypothetical protein
MPDMGIGESAEWCDAPYGRGLRDELPRKYGTSVGFLGRGEMIPNGNCFVDLDPYVRDKWGIPVLRFHWKYSEHEIRQASHMRRTFLQNIERLGGKVIDGTETDGAKLTTHEVGITRMVRPQEILWLINSARVGA